MVFVRFGVKKQSRGQLPQALLWLRAWSYNLYNYSYTCTVTVNYWFVISRGRLAVTFASVLVDITRSSQRQSKPGVVAVQLRTFIIAHLSTENSRRSCVRRYTLQQSNQINQDLVRLGPLWELLRTCFSTSLKARGLKQFLSPLTKRKYQSSEVTNSS